MRKAALTARSAIVLVRDRRAEHGHDRVADELLHGAAEPLDLLLHARVVGTEARADVLGIGAVGARGEADEVDEQHRDDLSLLRLARVRPQRGAARPAEPRPPGVVLATRRDMRHARSLRRHGYGAKPDRPAGSSVRGRGPRSAGPARPDRGARARGRTPPALLDELRGLVREAETWARLEGDERAAEAVERCDDALSTRINPRVGPRHRALGRRRENHRERARWPPR